jgi:hypothetical protein
VQSHAQGFGEQGDAEAGEGEQPQGDDVIRATDPECFLRVQEVGRGDGAEQRGVEAQPRSKKSAMKKTPGMNSRSG